MGFLDLVSSFVACRASATRPYGGIEIIPAPPFKLNSVTEVIEALDLIRCSDPRRFSRIQRYIRRIFLANYRSFVGCYRSFGQVCCLRKLPIPDSARSLAIYSYAATLVHESTHGLLEKKRIPHTSVNRRRIERICVSESVRFLARFPDMDRKYSRIVEYVDRGVMHKSRDMVSKQCDQPPQ